MNFYFEEAELWRQKKMSVFQRINKLGLPLVIFGRSSTTNPAFLQHIHVPERVICSTNPDSQGKKFWGLDVISPAAVQEKYSEYTLLILAVEFKKDEFVSMFRQLPVPPAEIFQLDMHFDEEGTAEYFRENRSVIEDNYNRMADQLSKDTYETMIRYRINRDPELLLSIVQPAEQHYFMNTLGGAPFLGEQEVFVDLGAFTGDTVNKFVAAVQGKYQTIHAFEPIPETYRRLMKNTEGIPNLTCWQKGVGGEAGQLRFLSKGMSSRPDELGEEIVQVDTLDRFLKDVPVTYIKMDIDGMEYPALTGAKKLIQTHRPKLGICIYHTNHDMVFVPQMMCSLNPDYRFYCRHYTPSVGDTVCYAV